MQTFPRGAPHRPVKGTQSCANTTTLEKRGHAARSLRVRKLSSANAATATFAKRTENISRVEQFRHIGAKALGKPLNGGVNRRAVAARRLRWHDKFLITMTQ